MAGSAQITNPGGAFGYTDLTNKLFKIEAEFEASAAITGPAVVSIQDDGQVATTATDGAPELAIGIAPRSIASGDIGGVVVYGIVENVPAEGAIAAGALVIRSDTTAGSVETIGAGTFGQAIGVAMSAAAGGVVDVWVFKA